MLKTIQKPEVKPGDLSSFGNAFDLLRSQKEELLFWSTYPEIESCQIDANYVRDYDNNGWSFSFLEVNFASKDDKNKILEGCRNQHNIDTQDENWLFELAFNLEGQHWLEGCIPQEEEEAFIISLIRPKNLKGAIAQVDYAIQQIMLDYLKQH